MIKCGVYWIGRVILSSKLRDALPRQQGGGGGGEGMTQSNSTKKRKWYREKKKIKARN